MPTEITSRDVTEFCRAMQELGIEIWIDGGWGVDALLGEQTRPHGDLDIVVQEHDCQAVVSHLQEQGFQELARDDSRACNFVMGNHEGKEVDFHVVVLDEDGNGIYGPLDAPEGIYPADALLGRGSIDGVAVKCTSPEYQLQSRIGYALGETDLKDIMALAEKFALVPPNEVCRAVKKDAR